MKRHLLALAAIALGAAVYAPAAMDGDLGALWGAGLGLWFVIAGVIARSRRPENRTGTIMVLVGLGWFVGRLKVFHVPILWTFGAVATFLWIVPLAHLLYSFPRGELRTRFERAMVVAVVLEAVGSQTVATMFLRPANYFSPCQGCPDSLNLILVRDDLDAVATIVRWLAPVDFLLLAVTAAMLVTRWRRSTRLQRQAFGPVCFAGLIGVSSYVVVVTAANFELFEHLIRPAYNVATVVLWAFPGLFLVGLLRSKSRRSRVSDLVVDLEAIPDQQAFQAALARTLGDPDLVLGVWSPEVGRYLTGAKEVMKLPEDNEGRVVTYLEGNGKPLAALVHDDALLEDPELVSGVAAAARLAVENEQLHGEIKAQLEEVRASRQRIVQAADDERRKVERDLHDGAQQRLVSLSLILGMARSKLADGVDGDPDLRATLETATKELEEALTELRELARGIHPQVLTEEGLGAALESLADRSSIRVILHSELVERLPAPVEAAGYFVVSEAITNAAKHAGASAVNVHVAMSDDALVLTIHDDGRGGACLQERGGLRGLLDRVHALDGSLEVESPVSAGTRLRVRIPCSPKAE